MKNCNINELDKYERMKKYLEENNTFNQNRNIIESLTSDLTLSQLAHIQTIFPLFTLSDSIDSILQIGKSDNFNDIFLYYYTSPKTLYPILYTQILNLCGSYESENYLFLNKKCIIFTNNTFIHPKILVDRFIVPFCKKLKIKKVDEFSEHLLNNIYVITYSSYFELLIKINDLPNILRNKIQDTALVIINGFNFINFHKIDLDFSKDFSKQRKMEFIFKKGKNRNSFSSGKKSLNQINNLFQGTENEEEICKLIISSISMIYSLYNFNLIFTCYYEQLKNFSYDSKNVIFKNFDNYKCCFNFKLPSKTLDSHKILFIEPIIECINDDRNIFGILAKGEKTEFIFKVYLKEEKSFKIKEIFNHEVNYEQKKDIFENKIG